MQIHNRDIYHCLKCGRLVRQEPDDEIPDCCGVPMVKAASETLETQEEPRDAQPSGATGNTPP